MNDKQSRKQYANMRDYDLYGDARRASERARYYRNRDAILARKKAQRETTG